MKAAVISKYGPPEVIQIDEIEKPSIKEDEVLVKVYATSLNVADVYERQGGFLARLAGGLRKPKKKVPGSDVSGVVVEVGSVVSNLKVGEKVYGFTKTGASAEFATASRWGVVKMPSNLTFSEAAGVPLAALTSVQYLRNLGNIEDGQKILINGASGGLGHFGLQYAKTFDAEVTAVCSSSNQQFVKELGADHFIDYTKVDFTKLDTKYNMIYDAVGKVSLSQWKRSLTDNGLFLNAGNPRMNFFKLILAVFGNRFRKKQMKFMITKIIASDMNYITELIEAGKMKPVINREYSFKDIVDAHKYHERGHTAGKVVVNIVDPDQEGSTIHQR